MRRALALHAPCSSFVESAVRACTLFAKAIFAAIGIIPGFQAYSQPPGSMPVLKSASPEAAAFPPIGGKAVAFAWNCSGPIRPGLRQSGCSKESRSPLRSDSNRTPMSGPTNRSASFPLQGRVVQHVRNAFIASRDVGAPCPKKARKARRNSELSRRACFPIRGGMGPHPFPGESRNRMPASRRKFRHSRGRS